MKIGITIIATNSYFVLGIRFIKRFIHFYKGDKEIIFYMFTDKDPKPYLPDNINVKYYHVIHNNWIEGTNSKFNNILMLENEDIDFNFYFDADTNVDKPFTEDWFLGDMVGGQHYADQSWMKEKKGFDRNPRSKAYVPHNTKLPQMYFYGAFFGGTRDRMVEFCKLMREYQIADKQWGYEPGVNDESYINREFHFNPPTKIVKTVDFKFLISDKGGIGQTRDMKLNVSTLLSDIKSLRNKNFDIRNGKIVEE